MAKETRLNMSQLDGTDLMALPGEEEIRQDIAHFERMVERLSKPSSIWEQGALKCYQLLARQRRKMLKDLQAVADC